MLRGRELSRRGWRQGALKQITSNWHLAILSLPSRVELPGTVSISRYRNLTWLYEVPRALVPFLLGQDTWFLEETNVYRFPISVAIPLGGLQEFFPFVKTLKEERPAAKSKAGGPLPLVRSYPAMPT